MLTGGGVVHHYSITFAPQGVGCLVDGGLDYPQRRDILSAPSMRSAVSLGAASMRRGERIRAKHRADLAPKARWTVQAFGRRAPHVKRAEYIAPTLGAILCK